MSSSNIYIILDDLVKLIVRAFYNDEHIVVIDALLKEKKRVRDEELAARLRLPTKFVRKVLSDLKNDSLLKSQEMKVEPKGPGDRATNVVLWYLDYTHIIYVLKFRLYMMRKKIDEQKAKKLDLQSYRCTTCSKRFTAYDIPRLLTMEGALECDSCGGLPQEEINGETSRSNVDQFAQIKKIIEQLKKTEGLQIPLFARDLAEDNQNTGPSLTINTNSSANYTKPIGAFTQNNSNSSNNNVSTRGMWMDPLSQNIEFFVDIFDSDNIDGGLLPSTVKKEVKKTGQSSVPPWLLSTIPKPAELELAAQSKSETVKIEKQLPLNVIPTKSIPLDEKFYLEYINKFFKEDMNLNSTETKKREPIEDIGLIPKKPKIDNLPEVHIGHDIKLITQITEEDQEKMTAQEYEEYSAALYNYVIATQ